MRRLVLLLTATPLALLAPLLFLASGGDDTSNEALASTPGQADSVIVDVGRYAFPLPLTAIKDPAVLGRPHHDYPALDIPVPVGTPAYAITDAVVLRAGWMGRCGLGVVLQLPDHHTWTYCHGSEVRIAAGARVNAGELILLTGSTGHSTGPHLHLGYRSPSGAQLEPRPIIQRIYHQGRLRMTAAAVAIRVDDRRGG